MSDKKEWFAGRMKLEIPMTVLHMKTKSIECFRLVNKRKEISTKLQEAIDFLENGKLDQPQLIKVLSQTRELNQQLSLLDKGIFDIIIEVVLIIEAKYANFGFSIKLPDIKKDTGETIKARRILAAGWLSALGDPNDEMVVIGPEDTLFFRAVQRAFGADPRTIEFEPASKFDDFWTDTLQSLRDDITRSESECEGNQSVEIKDL